MQRVYSRSLQNFEKFLENKMPGRRVSSGGEMDHLKVVDGFPDYEISEFGRVFHRKNNREMILSPTQMGELTVGMYRGGVQYRRSVKVLVARAFVPGETELFNTPIQLDGDRGNLRADNIVWRPRWFAWKYTQQFTNPKVWYNNGPILECVLNEVYSTILDAAVAHGSLCADIYGSIDTELAVFPGGENYVYYEG